MNKVVAVAASVAAFLILTAPAGATHGITKHDRQVVTFFANHPKLARTPAGATALASVLPRVMRSLQDAIATNIYSKTALVGDLSPPWPPRSTYPSWFLNDSDCIEMGESTDGAGSSNLYGMLDGWAAAGGTGSAWSASPLEQLYRVWVLEHADGWSPWSTAAGCGL